MDKLIPRSQKAPEDAKHFFESLAWILEHAGDENVLNNDYWQSARAAIAALDKQIPAPPIPHYGHYDCPVCKVPVNDKYCPNCGKRIDWWDKGDNT